MSDLAPAPRRVGEDTPASPPAPRPDGALREVTPQALLDALQRRAAWEASLARTHALSRRFSWVWRLGVVAALGGGVGLLARAGLGPGRRALTAALGEPGGLVAGLLVAALVGLFAFMGHNTLQQLARIRVPPSARARSWEAALIAALAALDALRASATLEAARDADGARVRLSATGGEVTLQASGDALVAELRGPVPEHIWRRRGRWNEATVLTWTPLGAHPDEGGRLVLRGLTHYAPDPRLIWAYTQALHEITALWPRRAGAAVAAPDARRLWLVGADGEGPGAPPRGAQRVTLAASERLPAWLLDSRWRQGLPMLGASSRGDLAVGLMASAATLLLMAYVHPAVGVLIAVALPLAYLATLFVLGRRGVSLGLRQVDAPYASVPWRSLQATVREALLARAPIALEHDPEAATLTLAGATIQLDAPFDVTLTRAPEDGARAEGARGEGGARLMTIELRQRPARGGQATRLRLSVTLAASPTLEALEAYAAQGPLVPAAALEAWLWPTIAFHAAAQGRALPWRLARA